MNDKDLEAFIQALPQDARDHLAQQLSKEMAAIDEDEEVNDRKRRRGMVLKEHMVFDVEVIVTCRTCGKLHNSTTKSSSNKPIHSTTVLCGVCKEHLEQLTKDELINLIIEKSRLENGIECHYKIYIPAVERELHDESEGTANGQEPESLPMDSQDGPEMPTDLLDESRQELHSDVE